MKLEMGYVSEAFLAADLADDMVLLEEALAVSLVAAVGPEIRKCGSCGHHRGTSFERTGEA
jgi:hypothetical protein